MQATPTKTSILKPIHSRRRRVPGAICLCAIDSATCPQCTRTADTQSSLEAPKARTVSFGPEVQICHFHKRETPRDIADDGRIAADSPRSTEMSLLDVLEIMLHGTCSIPRKSSEPTQKTAEPSASPNEGKKLGMSLAALAYAHPELFRGYPTALDIARDRAIVNYAEVSESKMVTRQLSNMEKQALANMDATEYSNAGDPSKWADGNRTQHFRLAAQFLAQGAQATRADDVFINGPYTPPLLAMTDLLQALTEVRGQGYSVGQLKTWKTTCQQLCMGLREVVVQNGRLVGAEELRMELVERVEGILGEDPVLMGRTVGARSLHCDFRTMVEWLVGVAAMVLEEREGVATKGRA
ncbi:hypothetical protein EJ03DRAFT_218956 [Teratosphaeria nubilosa]|uniref:Uncharacterized protein n=1 Tax=Teratosphaeria nubilosa TaxID=161662 RepID=A0A6G1KX56_9PEZI|nr:hypothetical protein EJ03DRAFT_218956 [Teratosphaeria nubilosa]